MFTVTKELMQRGQATRHVLSNNSSPLTWGQVVTFWKEEPDFCDHFTQLMADSPYAAYRWETPSVSAVTLQRPFEFVLLNEPRFCDRQTDSKTYEEYFTASDTNAGIVSFENISGDATLIVPSPRTDISAYGHLAAFLRHAPNSQHRALWQTIAARMLSRIGERPLWVSTAGGGVAWLHVRLDSRPKYYGYSPYRTF